MSPHTAEAGAESLGRILVVEDERIVARDLANTLSDLGYEVVATVATGDDAVQVCFVRDNGAGFSMGHDLLLRRLGPE